MSNYRTPGVYIEEIQKFPPSVAPVETAIPVFIGYTEKARKDGRDLTLDPLRISSLLEYQTFFGGPQKEIGIEVVFDEQTSGGSTYTAQFNEATGGSLHIMYYCLQQYFANGGGPCWIISVGSFTPFGQVISNSQPFLDALDAIRKEDEPTLIIFPEGQGMSRGEYFAIQQQSLRVCEEMKDRFAIIDFYDRVDPSRTAGDIAELAEEFRTDIGINDLKYGAVYFPNIRSTFNYDVEESSVILIHNVNGGEGNGEFNELTFNELNDANKAQVRLAINNFSIDLPPSASMAGLYAKVDRERGVWKAPANVSILGIDGLTFKVTDAIQDGLNIDVVAGKSINALRFFTGKGFLVWGARTLAGNDNEWRYVPVRRFFNFAEESIKKATEAFVFEPNDANTWNRVKSLIENFLVLQWRAGALQGPTPEQSFFVNVGLGETMTALDILEGRLIVEIGMAVVRPAEFIILRFSHKMAEA
ncbi:MAG: phage tail sheath C-terminal domain-containing protein [Bacteroidota bacterium]